MLRHDVFSIVKAVESTETGVVTKAVTVLGVELFNNGPWHLKLCDWQILYAISKHQAEAAALFPEGREWLEVADVKAALSSAVPHV